MKWIRGLLERLNSSSWGLRIKHLAPDGRVLSQRVLRRTGYLTPQEIALESGHQLRMTPLFYKGFDIRLDRNLGYSFSAAVLANVIVALLMTLSFRTPERFKSKIDDVSKVQVTLSQWSAMRPSAAEQAPDAATLAAQREAREASRLMKSWGVGKPIANANQVLKPSVYDKAFKTSAGGEKNLNSWSLDSEIDSDQLQKPLNLSDEVVAKALRSVSSELRECYNQVLIRDTTLKGKPQVVVDINLSGRVADLQLVGLTARDSSISQLRNCFLGAYRSVSLPKPNQSFVVTQTMVLEY